MAWRLLDGEVLRLIFTWLAFAFISRQVRIIVFLIKHLRILLNSNHSICFFVELGSSLGYLRCEMKLQASREACTKFFLESMGS